MKINYMKTISILLLNALLTFTSVAFAEVAIIVNPANNSTFSDDEISRIFLDKLKTFPNGEKAVPVNLKFGSSIRNEFEDKLLNKSSSQVKAYWSKLVFSGKGKPPAELVSDKDVIALVSSDSNVIAYIDAANVDDSVKVIKNIN